MPRVTAPRARGREVAGVETSTVFALAGGLARAPAGSPAANDERPRCTLETTSTAATLRSPAAWRGGFQAAPGARLPTACSCRNLASPFVTPLASRCPAPLPHALAVLPSRRVLFHYRSDGGSWRSGGARPPVGGNRRPMVGGPSRNAPARDARPQVGSSWRSRQQRPQAVSLTSRQSAGGEDRSLGQSRAPACLNCP